MWILILLGGYYLWGTDGWQTETYTACQAAQEQLSVCLDRGAQDAQAAAQAEIDRLLRR